MDKQISLLKAAIEEIEYTLNSNKDSEVKGIYLSNAVRFISSVIGELDRRDQDSISKSKLLEWLRSKETEFIEGQHTDHQEAIEQVMQEIQSGTFDQGDNK